MFLQNTVFKTEKSKKGAKKWKKQNKKKLFLLKISHKQDEVKYS